MVQVNIREQRLGPLPGEPLAWRGPVVSQERQQMALSWNAQQRNNGARCLTDEPEVVRESMAQQKASYRAARSGEKRVREGHANEPENAFVVNAVEDNCPEVRKRGMDVVDLGSFSHEALLSMAAEHRVSTGGENPFLDVWGNQLLEKVCLPPDRKPILPFTVGGGDPMCAKAWRSILGAGGMRSFGKFDGEPGAGEIDGVAQFVPTVTLSRLPEELRPFVQVLEDFLERKVSLPILSSTAEVLDLEKLLAEVVRMGGHEKVTSSKSWSTLAQALQGNGELGECLRQVYVYYLSPLEEQLPDKLPTRNVQSWMEKNVKERRALDLIFKQRDDTERPSKRMRCSNEQLAREAHNLVCALAQDPLQESVDDKESMETFASWNQTSADNLGKLSASTNPAEGGLGDEYYDKLAPWLLLRSYCNKRTGTPGVGLQPPVLKPPVALPIKLPFSLLATAGFTKKNTGKRTWLADSAGRRIVTPKCGVCRTCVNPQLKKACLTNRDRLAKGMEPLVVQPAAKLK